MRPRNRRIRRKFGDLNYYGLDTDRYPHAENVFKATLARLDKITRQLSDAAMEEKAISSRDIYRIRADVETIMTIPFKPIIYVGAEWPQALLDLIPAVDFQSAKN